MYISATQNADPYFFPIFIKGSILYTLYRTFYFFFNFLAYLGDFSISTHRKYHILKKELDSFPSCVHAVIYLISPL